MYMEIFLPLNSGQLAHYKKMFNLQKCLNTVLLDNYTAKAVYLAY